MSDLPNLVKIDQEWKSWRSFCQEFEDLTGIDINGDDCKRMIAALVRWGEELVELRKESPLEAAALESIREDAPIHPKAKRELPE
jgi:hypothetical protein